MARLFAWMLNFVYLALLAAAAPWILWSAWKHGKYREGFAEKFLGRVPVRSGNRPCIWLHAVSVGEVNLLATVINELARVHGTNTPPLAPPRHNSEIVAGEGEYDIAISTTTKAGYDLARKKYANHTVFYCPLDFSWATRSAVRRVRPDLFVLAELELWPNLISAAKEQGARVAIINGRLSDKSFRGYLRLRPLVARVLANIDVIAAQNAETAERFRQLGAAAARVCSTGSLKFDGAQTDRNNPKTRELRELAGIGADDVVFLAGSTQAPEEQMAIEVYRELVTEYPRLRLVLVPRHPQRFDEVAGLLAESGIPWIRRSHMSQPACASRSSPTRSASRLTDQPSAILLVDSVGELGAWWGAAAVGFVGGSFGSRGGQNMLEPAAYGVATCFGPNTWNFRDIVGQLLAVDGAMVVQNEGELKAFVRRALADPQWARYLGERGRQLVLAQQGATEMTVTLIEPLLPRRITSAHAA